MLRMEDTAQQLIQSTSSSSSFQNSGVQKCVEGRPVEGDAGCGEEIKVYRWRWVVLVVFVGTMSANNAVWIAYGPIADVVQCYYETTKFWVNTASMVYMLTYILFIVPSAWLLARAGLRTTLVIAASMNAAGACLRVAGAGEPAMTSIFHPRLRGFAICRSDVWEFLGDA